MRGATVFCAPSLHGESFGVVLLEAMAAGTPIVASAIEGYANVARPGREALLVEPGRRRRRCATRCAACSTTPRCATRLVAAGRARAAEFSMPASPSATSSSTRRRSSPRREHDCTRSVSEIEQLALETAARVRDAVAPSLGDPGARERVGVAPGGDVTMAIDEVAEAVVAQCLAAAGDIAFYSEDRGYVAYGDPARDLRRRPDRRHPTGRGRARVVLRVDRGRAAVGATRRSATCRSASCTRSRAATASSRAAAAARAPSAPTGARSRSHRSDEHRPRRVVLDRGLARPAGACRCRSCSRTVDRRLVDARRLLRSRLGHVQHDAHRDRAARRVRRHRAPPRRRAARARAALPAVGDGAVCTNFPYDVAAAGLIVQEAGGVVTHADGQSLDSHPAVGSGDGFGLAVLAARLAGPARVAAGRGRPRHGPAPRLARRQRTRPERGAKRPGATPTMTVFADSGGFPVIAAIIIIVIIVLAVIVFIVLLQRPRPAAEPGRQRVVADRRPAPAPARPDPEPRRDGQGLRRPRDARRSKRSRRRATTRCRRRGRPQQAQAENVLTGALRQLFARRRGVPRPEGEPELPEPAGGADVDRGPRRLRAAVLQRQCAQYNTKIQTLPSNIIAGMFNFSPARVLRG